MALTYTPETDFSLTLPSFQLPTVFGKSFHSHNLESARVKVLLFICNHCPYVKAIEDRLIALAQSYQDQPVHFLAICSNDPSEYPEDHPDELAKHAKLKGYPFDYLIDESQELAKLVGAVCTPDIFVFDDNNHLFYRGRLDDSWKDPSKVTRQELKMAIDAGLTAKPLEFKPVPSMGCSIKWKNRVLQ